MKLELNIDSEEFLYESSILVKSFLAQSGMEQELEEKKIRKVLQKVRKKNISKRN